MKAMHEIKFHGKRLDNGEWVVGSLIIDEITGKYYIPLSVDESEKIGEEGCLKIVSCEVNPETVGQYTGIKAKDVEIYSGSIIDQFDSRFVVVASPGGFHLDVYRKNHLCCGKQGEYVLSALSTGYCEVVGNVHDNPEIVEE